MNHAYKGFDACASFKALPVTHSSAPTPNGYNTQNVVYLQLPKRLAGIPQPQEEVRYIIEYIPSVERVSDNLCNTPCH